MSSANQVRDGEWKHVETVQRSTAFLPGLAASFIGYFPQYKDTKSGRRNAMQIRAVLLFIGISILAFAGIQSIPFGVVFCALALIVPILDTRKRELIRSFKRMKSIEKTQTKTVTIQLDDTHFETTLDGKFRSKRKAVKIEQGPDGKQVAQFKHVSKKTKVWFRSTDDADDDVAKVDRNRMTDIIDVDAATFQQLRGSE